MDFKDYYKILGIEPESELKAIKVAYRKLARKYHPDVSDHHEAEERFKEIAEAYEVLKDKNKRAEYDQLRQYGAQGQNFEPPPQWQNRQNFNQGAGSQGFSDFFSSIFGGGAGTENEFHEHHFHQQGEAQRKGQDIETDLPVFLEDTLKDEAKTISYNLPHYDGNGQVSQVKKTLKVKIPAGVSDGERIRLKGQGAQGVGDAPAGDLYLRIRLVPHYLFDVEGHNLTITVPVAPWEAALGAKITIPTLSGKIQLSIPANSQTGKRFRIKGKGLIGKVSNGDLYAVLKIVIPGSSSNEQSRQWKDLAKSSNFDPRAEWSDVK